MIYDWFKNIDFAYEEVFFLFLLLPLMAAWYILNQKRQQGSLLVSATSSFGKTNSWRVTARHSLFALRLLCIASLLLALARPQTRNDEELKSGEGIDIIICMDISGSMLAQDLTPNRFEAAKQLAADFVGQRTTDRIGVVIFAGESFTLSPLTTDKNILQSQIYGIQQGALEDGTAIGDGLGISVERLRNSPTKSKVIILLTDGEDQGGRISPLEGKELAKAYGIKVYTIGIGTEGYAPVPMQTSSGSIIVQRQKVNIDEKLLRQIAEETGGFYFRARDNESLKNIYAEIDKLEKTRIEITSLRRYTEKFHPFAIAAAAFLLLEIILRMTLFRKFP